jgi:AcrR family transcriptional regulator
LLFQKLVNYIHLMETRRGEALAAPEAERVVLKKLKPGPGLSREAVAMDQKLRLRVALSTLTAESGYDSVTVRALIRRASVSTSTFYNHYESVEHCLATIVGATIRQCVEEIRSGHDLDGDGLGPLRAGIRNLMKRLGEEPELTQAVFVEASAAGSRVQDEMSTALADFETVLAATLEMAPPPAAGTTHLAIGLVAGVVGVVRKTALTGRAGELPGLTDELTDWMLSVAHEEVVAFCVPRPRSEDGIVGGRLPSIGAAPASRESVADASHRAIMTTARLAATTGLTGLTSAKIRKDAGLSRREFEAHFTGVEDCFLDAIEMVSTMAVDAAGLSAPPTESWERWIYKTMTALCSLAAGDQNVARLVLLDITAPGPLGLIRREGLIGRAAAYVRGYAPPERRPSELRASASISAIWRIAEVEVAARRTVVLPRLAPVFVYMLLAARRERRHRPRASAIAFAGGETQSASLARPAA